MPLVHVMEPIDGMDTYERVIRITAGQIVGVVPAGCYVSNGENSSHMRAFDSAMDGRHNARVGDYWVIDENGRQYVMPKEQLDEQFMLKKKEEVDGIVDSTDSGTGTGTATIPRTSRKDRSSTT